MVTIYVCGDRSRVWLVASHCAAQFGPYAYDPAQYSWALIRHDFGLTRLSSSAADPLSDVRVNAAGGVYTRDMFSGDVRLGQSSFLPAPSFMEVPSGFSPYQWLWDSALPQLLPPDVVQSLRRQYKTLAAIRQKSRRAK